MRGVPVALVVASVLATAGQAADKPVIGPAPGWVRPVTPPGDSAKPDEAPIRVLLSDQQVALERGRTTVYSEVALKIQTPQGLSAGNISIPWRPDTDVLTVHKLLIRRGKELIDVLASGQTFTVVRREQNLESAMLDGVLTANIQPEGLQVGDVLEFATSTSSSDPTLKGHVEQISGVWNGFPIGRAHLRMQWPSTLPVRFRETGALPAMKPVKAGGMAAVELSLDNVQPIAPPKGAPARYAMGRQVEVTDYASWADLGALMAPLYDKAAALPAAGPLRVELERIKALSPDPRTRAEAALALVENRVRYVALAMGAGGYVPADAEVTWSRRYGDCKGKTALLLALLRGLDIPAEPVAVSTVLGDGADARLPMVGLFNHVIVRATVAGRQYWMDGTRIGDTSLDRLKTPPFGWGLPLVAANAALVRMMPAPLQEPTNSTTIRIDARAGLTVPAPVRVETVFRGDEAIAGNAAVSNLAGDARDRALRDYWKGRFDFVEVTSTSATFDAKTGEQRLVMDGKAKMDWSTGWYETDETGIGYKADFSRDAGPDRDAPFAVPYPYYTRVSETILLPPGFADGRTELKPDVNQTVAGVEYRRQSSLSNGTFTIEKTERSVQPEFPASEAAAAQATLRSLAGQTVYLRRPNGYRPTPAEVQKDLATTPTTAADFIRRGNLFMDQSRYDEAIKDLSEAATRDPKDPWALANRGFAYVWKGDYAAAGKDLDAAAALDPKNAVVFRARGVMAEKKGEAASAVGFFSRSLEAEPDNAFALGHRAWADRAMGNEDAALKDAAAAVKQDPHWVDMYLFRANILRSQGKMEEALKEAEAIQAANPENNYAQVAAANLYNAGGKKPEAMRAYDRALAIKPEPYIYLNRSMIRPKTDVAGRRADVDAALKLDSGDIDTLSAKASLEVDTGDLKAAAATYSLALQKLPGDPMIMTNRGIVFARAGDQARAGKDFAAARAKASEAVVLNNMCWAKAIAGVGLDSALADCDAAVAKVPGEAGFIDSRGLVLLRLGRIDDAIAEYDRALAKSPRLSSSLFGRSVAWSRKGNKAKSDADAAAAIKVEPDIRERFERYGVGT